MVKTPTRETQDWQIEAYEMRGRHNSVIRHQRVIEEMDAHPTVWGVNMSKGKK